MLQTAGRCIAGLKPVEAGCFAASALPCGNIETAASL